MWNSDKLGIDGNLWENGNLFLHDSKLKYQGWLVKMKENTFIPRVKIDYA